MILPWRLGCVGTWCLLVLLVGVSGARAESLREAAAKFPGLRVGAALNPDTLSGSEAVYANTVRSQFNLPSPENATKWAALRPAQYTFDWTDADVIARFARAGGQQSRGHTLVWHNSLPGWLTGGGFTTDQIRALLFHHIDTVVGRYRDDLFCWDVVNEAFNSDGTLRDSFWYNQPGIGYATNGTRYIEEAFRRAATANPSAILIYNDYDAETVNTKSDAIYGMAQDFLSRGVPLHGIGFQMHRTGLDYTSLRNNLKRFNDLGLELHITEMDIRIPVNSNGVATQADLDAQAEVYWNVVGVALGQPRFKVFQTWGVTDKYSWIPGFFPGYGAALLFDENYQRKPAYWSIWNALANQAEKLLVLEVSSGDSTNVFGQAELSAGAGMQLQANATNDYITLALAVPFAGAWDVKVGYRCSGASGQFQLAVAPAGSASFSNVGNIVDAYSVAIGTGVTDFGTNAFASAGNWQFRFTVAGKNPSASGYNLTIDYIRITPVVTVANTAPTISSVTDKTTTENTPVGPVAFTIGDTQTAASTLTLQAISFKPDLLPNENIVFGGSGANRTVTLTPAVNQFGTAAVLLLVSDGTNQTPETFMLRVVPVNNPPSTLMTNVEVTNTSVDINLLPLVNDVETTPADLRFQVSGAVDGSVTLLGDGHTARFTPATNAFAPASFDYVVTDTASEGAPDARWLLEYDFEPSDSGDDKSVTDKSANALAGTLEEFGLGQSGYDTNVPPLLGGLSTHSLSLAESGAGNAARLEVLLPSATYNLRNSDWSLVLWFRCATATNDDFLFHVGAGDGFGGDGDELELALTTGGQLQLRHYNTFNAQDVNIASGVVPAGQWHHVAIVFDRTANNAGTLALYLDAVQVGATTAVSWSLDQTSELVFGGVKKGNEARWLNGNLDDVALFSVALSAAEIGALAAGRTVAQLGGLSRTNTVTLTFPASNQPPVLTMLSDQQLIAGAPLSVVASGYDPDSPAQTLAFSLVNPPAGAAINSTNGLVTWRPTMAQSGSNNFFQVVATEAGWSTNLTPQADTYVRDGSFATTNFGADTILTVKLDPTAGFSREAFLRFAVPSYPGALASAQVRLVPGSASQPGTHAVALVTNDAWDETTLTWSTRPGSGPALATWVPQAGVPAQIFLPAAATQSAATDGLLSLRVYATNSTADGRVDYVSREGAAASVPRLALVYTNSQPLSVTQSFWVKVVSPPQPVLFGAAYAGNAFRMNVTGDGGPDYAVQVSTNLQTWQTLFTTNSAPGPFQFGFTNTASAPWQFYRVRLGP